MYHYKITLSLSDCRFRKNLYRIFDLYRGRRGRDPMVVEFTTIYAISAYHH
jgi:hypothetical protein